MDIGFLVLQIHRTNTINHSDMKVENPVFIPLGGGPRAQCLSRLAAAYEPRLYPAWRRPTGPGFILLGGSPRAQVLSRLAAILKKAPQSGALI